MSNTWVHDIRFALRLLRKSPLFTVTAALSLAIGIGANATIFSVGSAMLLRPMPGLARPDRLVDIGRSSRGASFDTVSYPNYADIRDRTTMLSGVYAYQIEPSPMSLAAGGEPERVYGALVTGNYFSVLGTAPRLGRLLSSSDDRIGHGHAVAVISHDLWTRRFAADTGIVGRAVAINGYPVTIVGVMSHGFQGTTLLKGDLWLPLSSLTQAMPDRQASLFTSRRPGSSWGGGSRTA